MLFLNAIPTGVVEAKHMGRSLVIPVGSKLLRIACDANAIVWVQVSRGALR